MHQNKMSAIAIICLTIIMSFTLVSIVSAYDEVTNSFYTPKERFRFPDEYDAYCERMYKEGYMTKNHRWIPDAVEFIENPTVESSQKLDETRKVIIQERIESGEMLPEESPFLTYEEREDIIKRRENGTLVEHKKEDDDDYVPSIEPDDEEDADMSETEENETNIDNIQEEESDETQPEEESKGVWGIVGNVIIALGIVLVLIAGYYIYKRQF